MQMVKGKKLYYFEGRNTPVVASSIEEARKRCRRGCGKLVRTRTPNATERRQIAAGRWVTTRRDGKPRGSSSVGHGRGYGPPRKKYRISKEIFRIEL